MDINNPNYDVFHIPTQAGADEDDQYNGSIGDAVQQHVYKLNGSERQLWEEMIHTSDGNLFRVIPSLDMIDKEEEDEEEKKRREESEDVLDQCELVPYEEWEKFPQMWNTIEIPKTPKDRFMYCGNTKQDYYDIFPEGHPNTNAINTILSQVRAKDPHDIDDGYKKWIIQNIYTAKLAGHLFEYVANHLTYMINNIVIKPNLAEEFIINAISNIDTDWSKEFNNTAHIQLANNPMYSLLALQEKQWEDRYKQGESVYTDVKTFGQSIFNDTTLRAKMTKGLWYKYRQLKAKFAPKVIVAGQDINRCNLGTLRQVFKCDDNIARNIWHKRPYESLAEMYQLQVISKKNFGDTEDTDKVIDWIEQIAEKCRVHKNIKALNVASQRITTAQAERKVNFTEDQWHMIWAYLRICKQNVVEYINGKGKQNGF